MSILGGNFETLAVFMSSGKVSCSRHNDRGQAMYRLKSILLWRVGESRVQPKNDLVERDIWISPLGKWE